MKLTVYLPDPIGERVKAEGGFNLSRMLRDAVTAELDQRDSSRRSDDQMEGATA